jgi:hypothetical protein
MNTADLDLLLKLWAAGYQLRVFPRRPGGETRAVRVRNQFGDSYVICVTPDPTGMVSVKVDSTDGVLRRTFRWRPLAFDFIKTVAPMDLAATLDEAFNATAARVRQSRRSAYANAVDRFLAFIRPSTTR